jgi:hypothetical protein
MTLCLESKDKVNRRKAIQSLSLICGGTLFGVDSFLRGQAVVGAVDGRKLLSLADIDLLEEVAETIIPATRSCPGAKAAGIGSFMAEIVVDYYTPEERETFIKGIPQLKNDCLTRYGRNFKKLSPSQRHAFLMGYEQSQAFECYFMIKQLTVWGYLSSEVGQTEALALNPVPGRYEGCIPLQPGQRCWA